MSPTLTDPLISVCIPVFNGEKYIRECIASVLRQSEIDFEILISDNCSTDQTLKICNEFKDPKIRVLTNPRNVGSVANFNKCIQNASGEFFMLLPADDLLEADCLQILSRGFTGNPSVGMAFGSVNLIDEQGGKNKTNTVVEYDGVFESRGALKLIAEKFNPIQHPMVRSNIFADVGGYDPSNGGYCDIHLWLKVLSAGWKAYVVSKPLTALRCHEDQGQRLFRQGNLKKLSDHYGHSLPSDFFKKNHSSLQFFRFVQFFSHCNDGALDSHQETEKLMMANLVRLHLSSFFFSLRHFNLSGCLSEITLSIKLMKTYGLARILYSYISTVSSVLRKILFKQQPVKQQP